MERLAEQKLGVQPTVLYMDFMGIRWTIIEMQSEICYVKVLFRVFSVFFLLGSQASKPSKNLGNPQGLKM